jgi:hypothetical protein
MTYWTATAGAMQMKKKVPGVKAEVKRLLIKNSDMRPVELREALKERGWELSTFALSVIRREFRQTLRFLQDRNLLTRDLV